MHLKQILAAGVLVAVVGAGAAAFYYFTPQASETDDAGGNETELVTYRSAELGVEFEYPETYTLETHNQDTTEREWTVLTIIDSEVLRSARENGASEGPPAITVQVFNNPENYSMEEWITELTQYSNSHLANDSELLSGEVGGVPALAYLYSGLFETHAVVVAHEDKIYFFTVDWMTQEDISLRDFGYLLESVRFI